MKNIFRFIKAFRQLPLAVKSEVANYFFRKILLIKPNSHQTIWTSFLYFAKENSNAGLIDKGRYYVAYFYFNGANRHVYLRKDKSTDIFVFFQVFIAKGYHPLLSLLDEKKISPKVVIDAGANVGYFSILIALYGNVESLIAIEPVPSNFELLKTNIENIDAHPSIHLLEAALWSRNGKLSLIPNKGGEWSTQVVEDLSNANYCEAFSLETILQKYAIHQIDVLKIDIEGAESVLFNDANFIQCLSRVKVIAIEIHDHLADRNQIKQVLNEAGFYLQEVGELSIGWKNK